MGRRLLTLLVAALAGLGDGDDPKPEPLELSKPVVCKKIHGFASFEELPGASLTADDKLTVYSEPGGYKIEETKDGFRALLFQDARLRKKGGKDAVWKKDKLGEYEPKSKMPPYQLYLRSDLSLKGIPPGEYELDLTLRDGLTKGTAATRTVGFTVVKSPDPDAKPVEAEGKEKTPPETKKPPRGRRRLP